MEQSGRNRVPEIAEPLELFEFVQAAPSASEGMRLLLSPRAELRIADIDTAGRIDAAGGTAATVLIGPEGGLAEVEQEVSQRNGFTAVRMGPRVLRTETAAVCALTLLQQKFGDL